MDERDSNGDVINEESRCFVCDAKVRGRYYALATCRTQISQTRVIEKLGELVGERYMVVISEDDVICRSCAILINNLDRLEGEICNTRDHVLRFLEQKYSLEDGELRGSSDKPKPCQPPQITKSNTKEITSCKRKKSHLLLQCDKCKYTTHLQSFMMHHLRDHTKQKVFCNKCELCVSEKQLDTKHSCTKTNDSGNKENEKDNSGTIARNDFMEKPLLNNAAQPILSRIQTTSPPSLIDLSNSDHLYISNILPAKDVPTTPIQPMFVLEPLDIVDINNSGKMMSRLESNPIQEMKTETKIESRKQALILLEDGSLKITEAPW